ncbi:MAG: efflux RND transporter periplasmic adaptor subunit [Candidatus Eremiobacteraeota bacterium]|nr:efflux RND transporter periplasmic adaptor subunit [Candidatus Eremiobacteraeota bacterium]
MTSRFAMLRRNLIVLPLLTAGLGLGGCSHATTTAAAAPPVVTTSLAHETTLQPNQQLPGLIAPFANVAIQSTLTEPVDSVTVQEGDRVQRGEVLARLDTADLDAQLAADLATARGDAASATHTSDQGALTIAQSRQTVTGVRAAVAQALQTLAKDTIDARRYQQLAANGYISDQQVATQNALVRNDASAVRSAKASLLSAREAVAANGTLQGNGLQASAVQQARATQQVALAQADQVRTSIAKATIVSPIDGVVVNRNLNVGEYPGTRQIFTLQQVDPVYAVLRGSGAQIARIATNASARIVASDVSRTPISGTVIGVLNQINPGSTDFQVKVLLANTQRRLRPGMAVVGSIKLPTVRGVAIPMTAFTDDVHGSVLVIDGDATVRTAHVSETADDGKTAIVAGLAAGTRVISDGQASVGDGQKVAVR